MKFTIGFEKEDAKKFHEYEDESEKIAEVINKINEKRNYFKEILETLDGKA